MWKWLHPYAKSEVQYDICGKFIPFFAVLSVLLLVVGLFWGLAIAPADYEQGNAFRIMYIHVPSAIWSMGIYVSMAIAGLIALVWQIKNAYISMIAMAPIGAVFTFIALITGAIWGKPMWGTWWVWDARLTSELILFFLYLGVIALYSAFQNRETGMKAAAILCLVGVINIPIIHYSVVWWNTLHQGASITSFRKSSIAEPMLIPLILCIFGFLALYIWLTLVRYRTDLLLAEQKRPWVKALLLKEK
ncbi:heme ABC transporter permease [Actinobacillus delphinicola]|uniref:Heme exporter protein C n=1 Tax=Actinobacillus delphinicola TaxID=51161 RepID=A0A448TUT4_9PAST|nr:heme ABC transporter permease [Actinobacillus delphinicola]MDG6897736.1 heme ABC transporter permease [Actinobacillus delphinicola]VEJ09618.1 heme exporter protein CcmC [Actinobacillus delphinicola]